MGVVRCCAALPLIAALAAWFDVGELNSPTSPIAVILADNPPSKTDPSAWGGDHVGQPVPEFVTGDECLFCHRKDVGPTWSKNRHQLTVRAAESDSPEMKALGELPATKSPAGEVEFLLGGARRTRFLKRGKDYGTLSLLSAELAPAGKEKPARLLHAENPHWDDEDFGLKCSGCHATGVDTKTHAFAAVSLDCYVCHGDATLDHSKDTSKMVLSKARHDDPRIVVSICGQCHIRTGKSRSTGLPYANNFVAGDNLFRDLEADFSDAALAKLNPADRHVLENVRDVARNHRETVTCLSCHDVHKQSSRKHHRVAEGAICLSCHNADGPKSRRPNYEVHSPLCGY